MSQIFNHDGLKVFLPGMLKSEGATLPADANLDELVDLFIEYLETDDYLMGNFKDLVESFFDIRLRMHLDGSDEEYDDYLKNQENMERKLTSLRERMEWRRKRHP